MAAQMYGIDPDEVRTIINKIVLYAENEEKYIQDIVTALSSLQSAYNGSSTKDVLAEKTKFIITLLYTLLENRKNYIRALNNAISSYTSQNEYFVKSFTK